MIGDDWEGIKGGGETKLDLLAPQQYPKFSLRTYSDIQNDLKEEGFPNPNDLAIRASGHFHRCHPFDGFALRSPADLSLPIRIAQFTEAYSTKDTQSSLTPGQHLV